MFLWCQIFFPMKGWDNAFPILLAGIVYQNLFRALSIISTPFSSRCLSHPGIVIGAHENSQRYQLF